MSDNIATVIEAGGVFALDMPAMFWESKLVTGNERFDMLALEDGMLLIRACPHTKTSYRVAWGHADDSAWTEGSVCGLTKWVCVGCDATTIVESEDDFPRGWFEISEKKANGDTLAFEGVCSRACLAAFAGKSVPLRACRIPGFAGEADAPESADDDLTCEPADGEA